MIDFIFSQQTFFQDDITDSTTSGICFFRKRRCCFIAKGVATMLLRYQRNDSTSIRIVHDLLQDPRVIYQRMYLHRF